MNAIIPIGSGKGGVGKTILAANLGVALAARGKRTVLVDLDLGGSNLHTCLGIANRHPSIGDWVYSEDKSAKVDSLIVKTDFRNLGFIPGDGLLPGTANLPFFKKRKLLQSFQNIDADYVIVDLAAGTAHNTVDFFLMSRSGFVTMTPETTSILNAYSFLKNALFRMLSQGFPRKNQCRSIIDDFISQKIETQSNPVMSLIARVGEADTMSGLRLHDELQQFRPRIIINDGKARRDILIGGKLREIVRKNLGVEVEYIGYIAHNEKIRESVLRRKPAYLLLPESDFSASIDAIARRVIASPVPGPSSIYPEDEDLEVLAHAVE